MEPMIINGKNEGALENNMLSDIEEVLENKDALENKTLSEIEVLENKKLS